MIGFFADLDGDDTITLRDNELQEAKWFAYDEIPPSMDNLSIAQEMIEVVRQRKHTTLKNRWIISYYVDRALPIMIW